MLTLVSGILFGIQGLGVGKGLSVGIGVLGRVGFTGVGKGVEVGFGVGINSGPLPTTT